MTGLPLCGMIFSRDRAMQLDAALASFYRHARDGAGLELAVIYATGNTFHARQYDELKAAYAAQPGLRFIRQGRFRQDVLTVLAEGARPPWGLGAYCRIAGLHRRLGFLAWPLFGLWRMRRTLPRFILFLVDDNLFVRDFRLVDCIAALSEAPDALGFSLRLGRNTTWCYAHAQPQALPAFRPGPGETLSFDWTRAEADFHYPLEVSSSIYRIADLLPFLSSMRFANPNQLEGGLAASTSRFRFGPRLLCYPQSVTFCNPVNKVQTQYDNLAGTQIAYSSQDLAERFARGQRVDVTAYDNFVPTGCHQEVALVFKGDV